MNTVELKISENAERQRLELFIRIAGLLIVLLAHNTALSKQTAALEPYTRVITVTGFTEPASTVKIASEVAGKIREITVDVGDIVPDDGYIALLDDTFVQLEIEKNRISVRQLQQQLSFEKKTLARFESLISKNSTAQANYDEAKVNATILELRLLNLEKEALILKEQLERHSLRGYEGWQVTQRFAEPGEVVSVGQPLLELADFSKLAVKYSLSIEELGLLQNSRVLKLPEIDTEVEFEIDSISPVSDPLTRKVDVELILQGNPLERQQPLRGGLRCVLQLNGKAEKDLYRIPLSAIESRYEAHWLTDTEGNRIKIVLVDIEHDGGLAVITGENMAEGKLYVLNPMGQ